MAKFLANENVPAEAVEAARNAGYDLAWVHESHAGADDDTVLSLSLSEERVRAAYFAQKNRRGGTVETLDSTTGQSAEDRAAYNLIMKDKERLLSFQEPVAFIFSHSALREGWDNPNVSQIYTLNQTISEVKKRQEVGRGMRLIVNQQGVRVPDPKLNVLTVIAKAVRGPIRKTVTAIRHPSTRAIQQLLDLDVSRPDGRLVGFGTLDVCSECQEFTGGKLHPYIPLLAVNPTIKSRGYGTSIVRHLIDEAALLVLRGICHDVLFLDVYTTSEKAIQVYTACGFACVTPKPIPDPQEDGKTYIVMAKRVSGPWNGNPKKAVQKPMH